MPFVEMNGEKYFYAGEPEREGLPILFCHGSGGNHRHWLYQMKELSGAANPLAVDLPGHGRSEGSPSDSIAAYRQWVHEFAAALSLPPFVLAGHSMGGAVALDYALNHPAELAGLVPVGTGGRLRVAPVILETLRGGQLPPGMADYAYGPDTAPELLEQGRREMENTAAAVFLSDFTACDRFDVMEQLPGISLPALVICGSADRLTPAKYSRYLTQSLSRAELVEIDGAGHMVMLEAQAQVNRAISDFMKEAAEAS
jgi:pimeloyl-ACP methyl ester carboxylesterase